MRTTELQDQKFALKRPTVAMFHEDIVRFPSDECRHNVPFPVRWSYLGQNSALVEHVPKGRGVGIRSARAVQVWQET